MYTGYVCKFKLNNGRLGLERNQRRCFRDGAKSSYETLVKLLIARLDFEI
jgi:hypothetical protein